jgi:predicted MFS family arabinose efflux permease
MLLVPEQKVQKALAVIYMGNALATAFAAPIGSYVGGLIGWRGVFWALAPLAVISMIWQWISLPPMAPQEPTPISRLFVLLKRRNVAFAMAGTMLTFSGAFASFTYFRPFLESQVHANLTQLSFLLLALGLAGFAGTSLASRFISSHLYAFLGWLPGILAVCTVSLLAAQKHLYLVALMMVAWGVTYSALPVCWSTWLSKGVKDEPESGGGLMVGVIQLAIMSGGALGGLLLDHVSIAASFIGGAGLLLLSTLVVGNGDRLRPQDRGSAKAFSRNQSSVMAIARD